jgi:hypothetical protein
VEPEPAVNAGELRSLPDALFSLSVDFETKSSTAFKSCSFDDNSDLTLDFFFFLDGGLAPNSTDIQKEHSLLDDAALGNPSFQLEGATRAKVIIGHGRRNQKAMQTRQTQIES